MADLYELDADRLVELERFAEQSAAQLVRSIADSKARPLSTLLFGLGIHHVGKTVAVLLARRFGTMAALRDASEDAINEVPGVGPVIAAAVHHFFRTARNRHLVERLERLGLGMTEPDATVTDGPLTGMTVVLTGTLPTLSRTEATALVERAGGRVSGSREQEDRRSWWPAATPAASSRRPRPLASRSSTRRSSCAASPRARNLPARRTP